MTTKEKITYKTLKDNLEQHYGTEQYFRTNPFVPIVVTEGVKYFADTCECYWLLDEIMLRTFKIHQQLGYLFFDIEVNKRGTVHITARQDEGMPIVFERKVRDLCKLIPVGSYKLWLMNNVILLPNEY